MALGDISSFFFFFIFIVFTQVKSSGDFWNIVELGISSESPVGVTEAAKGTQGFVSASPEFVLHT